MQPNFMIIGLTQDTAPASVWQRFWISDSRTYEALGELSRAEGVEELVVVASHERTEFLLWTADASLAANSVLRFLTAEYGLTLCEWKTFYRRLDESALEHLFRTAAGPRGASELETALQQAQSLGACGTVLAAVLQKALAVAQSASSIGQDEVFRSEARRFQKELLAGYGAAFTFKLRHRISEFCRKELEIFARQYGPLPEDQERLLKQVSWRVAQKAAAEVTREVSQIADRSDREGTQLLLNRMLEPEKRVAASAAK